MELKWQDCRNLYSHTHTHYSCQDHRPYPPPPRNFYAGIRRIRKVVLENIGGGQPPPLLPPFPALLIVCRQKPIGLTNKRSTDLDTAKIELFSHIYFQPRQLRGPRVAFFEA